MGRIPLESTQHPRGAERRHFRGAFAVEAVRRLQERAAEPEELIDWLGAGGPTAAGVMRRVKSLYGFGEWVSWKVPDICERLGLMHVAFKDQDVALMFSSSKEGALETFRRHVRRGEDPLLAAHKWLQYQLRGFKSPPQYDRAVNVQETETVFCKWKSYLGGHYPPGKDTREIRHGLMRYGRCRLAQRMIKTLSSLEGSGS